MTQEETQHGSSNYQQYKKLYQPYSFQVLFCNYIYLRVNTLIEFQILLSVKIPMIQDSELKSQLLTWSHTSKSKN